MYVTPHGEGRCRQREREKAAAMNHHSVPLNIAAVRMDSQSVQWVHFLPFVMSVCLPIPPSEHWLFPHQCDPFINCIGLAACEAYLQLYQNQNKKRRLVVTEHAVLYPVLDTKEYNRRQNDRNQQTANSKNGHAAQFWCALFFFLLWERAPSWTPSNSWTYSINFSHFNTRHADPVPRCRMAKGTAWRTLPETSDRLALRPGGMVKATPALSRCLKAHPILLGDDPNDKHWSVRVMEMAKCTSHYSLPWWGKIEHQYR